MSLSLQFDLFGYGLSLSTGKLVEEEEFYGETGSIPLAVETEPEYETEDEGEDACRSKKQATRPSPTARASSQTARVGFM